MSNIKKIHLSIKNGHRELTSKYLIFMVEFFYN